MKNVITKKEVWEEVSKDGDCPESVFNYIWRKSIKIGCNDLVDKLDHIKTEFIVDSVKWSEQSADYLERRLREYI